MSKDVLSPALSLISILVYLLLPAPRGSITLDMTSPQPTPTPSAPTSKLPFPLQDGEQVLQVCRRHWLYLWPTLVSMLLLAIVPLTAIALLLSSLGGYHGVGALIFRVVSLIYLLFWAARIFLAWYRYQHDIWVITNQRLIDSYKRHPFSLRVATADLVNVQDMTVERDGLLRTVFDYGDLVCQTAATEQDFRIAGVPNPRAVQALVDRERDRERLRTR